MSQKYLLLVIPLFSVPRLSSADPLTYKRPEGRQPATQPKLPKERTFLEAGVTTKIVGFVKRHPLKIVGVVLSSLTITWLCLQPLKKNKLIVGAKAPPFEGKTQDGKVVKLGDFAGKKLVLYFYPRDNTPACTKQARKLRDGYERLKRAGYAVVGVSEDSVASHKRFQEKHNLPFPLISDSDKKITSAYGVARRFWYPRRTTFIINEQGYIVRIITNVKIEEHVDEILAM